MDFSGVTADTSGNVTEAIDYILLLNISPADKKSRISRVVELVGESYHTQLYGAASQVFDSSAVSTAGVNDETAQAQRLADKIVRNFALSRPTAALIEEYYNSLLGQAQSEAFKNAVSMQKHPTLTRRIVGETCPWCEGKAGTHIDPTSEDFSRHHECDCLFVVAGYNTRNGLLTNYVKR